MAMRSSSLNLSFKAPTSYGILLILLIVSPITQAQSVRTQNGTLVLETLGATLTLAAQSGQNIGAGGGGGGVLAFQSDVNNAIASTVSTLQPQVFCGYGV